MKILDRYILISFLRTFISVFLILFFVFILQGVWLFISDLAGKDLDAASILKFMVFFMPSIVPMALPLSILLASIMTFGNLSENYEFAAMKSAGVSLQRVMRSLMVFIFLLSGLAFLFANNVIPYSQYRFLNFKSNIAQVKPAMAISESQFSEIGSFNIKVDKKSGEKGNDLTGVTIHKSSQNSISNTTVIKAKRGKLLSSENSNTLQLALYDGIQYEDIIPKKYEERQKLPFTKTSFKQYNINIDLTKLNKVDVNEANINNSSSMLTIGELNYALDSLKKDINKEKKSFADNIKYKPNLVIAKEADTLKKDSVSKKITSSLNYFDKLSNSEKVRVLDNALGTISSLQFSISGSSDEFSYKQKNINLHWLSIFDKFVIAYACVLMFFIGAPLGAIIRKGGFGLPIVFAILIFIIFHFTNTFGKKIAQEDGMPPFLGSWLSSIILTPLALSLTYRATNDTGLINFDGINSFFQRIFQKKSAN
ncbi:LptF/LptG family permease [Flavobacterium sp.]|uniref:LptF/LptG family permease n=1 Tax=Flavobacterium sp. TaxID=239 RepID=UPI003B9948FC